MFNYIVTKRPCLNWNDIGRMDLMDSDAEQSMITMKIGQQEREVADVDESWINSELRRIRAAGEADCVRVRIDTTSATAVLTTSACPSETGGREPNSTERRLFAIWDELGLNEPEFASGRLIAFLHRVEDLL